MRESARQAQQSNGVGEMLHHEDLVIGEPRRLGSKVVQREELLAFRRDFDPEPPPLDAKACLCASQLHVCAMMMRLFCDGFLRHVASLGAPGVDEVRLPVPVRPGDVLTSRCTITDKRELASRPDVGMATVVVEALNGEGKLAAGWISHQLTQRRDRAPAPGNGRPRRPRPPLVSLWDDAAPASPPACDGFFEDCPIGKTVAFGRHTFGREEIIEFARQFDPQPFHIDAVAARTSLFRALCASGWHTAVIAGREIASARLSANAAARARGIRLPWVKLAGLRNVTWPRPVYIGDSVEFRGRLTEKIAHSSDPERGMVASEVQGRNQRGELVFAATRELLIERREAGHRASSPLAC